MTTPATPICYTCARFRPWVPGVCCDAFPAGVPDAIIQTGEHFKPIAGDRGLTFLEGKPPKTLPPDWEKQVEIGTAGTE